MMGGSKSSIEGRLDSGKCDWDPTGVHTRTNVQLSYAPECLVHAITTHVQDWLWIRGTLHYKSKTLWWWILNASKPGKRDVTLGETGSWRRSEMLDSGKSIIVTSGQLTTSFWHRWGIFLHYILNWHLSCRDLTREKSQLPYVLDSGQTWKQSLLKSHPQWGQWDFLIGSCSIPGRNTAFYLHLSFKYKLH